jgi:DNA-binding LytR/AlgR family response regulator
MKCIIIEDQLPAQRILKKYISDIGSLQLIAVFSDAIKAMEMIHSGQQIDLIFLDVHLPRLSGMDFLKAIPNPPQVILTTAFPDYALESYDLDVVDYLLKPFSFQRFLKAVSKVTTRKNTLESTEEKNFNTTEIFIKSGYEHIKININEILYINSDSDYTDIYTSNKKFVSSESLKYWESKLGLHDFIRVHKSYVINMAKVEKIVGNQIYLAENIKIPIGRVYKTIFTDKFIK